MARVHSPLARGHRITLPSSPALGHPRMEALMFMDCGVGKCCPSSSVLSQLGFGYCNKNTDQKQPVEERVDLTHPSEPQFMNTGKRGRDARQEPGGRNCRGRGVPLAGLLPMTALYAIQDPPAQIVPPESLINQENTPQSCLLANLIEVLSLLRQLWLVSS